MKEEAVFDLLRKIELGHEVTNEEREELASVESLRWTYYLETLPESLMFLKNLKSLDLHGTGIFNIDSLRSLHSLIDLDLSDNPLLKNLKPLSGLKGLKNLSLRNTSVNDISVLSYMQGLIKLDLSDTRVSDISPLSSLKSLTHLNLHGNNSLANIRGISGLKKLINLDLHGTIISDISELSVLNCLANLDLSQNKNLTNISSLSELENLISLDLHGTSVGDISALSGLTTLEKLDLSQNIKLTDISPLSELESLIILDLHDTKVSDIYALSGLKKLTRIDLRFLNLSAIPEFFIDLKLKFITANDMGFGILLYGTTLSDQPFDIFKQSRDDIVEYFKSGKDKSPVNECKVVFLGDGGAGKSLIIERILREGGEASGHNGESTPGICISSKQYLIDDEKIELHFWDFGGQAIMHSMHRLFLTNRTLYVVVANARDNKANSQAWYWIRNIKSFADGAPVFLLINQKDQNPSVNVNENGLRKAYPELKSVQIISALNDTKESFCRTVIDEICKMVAGMETVNTPFPRPWLALMNDLQNMKEEFITSEVFYRKCRKNGVGTEEKLIDRVISWYQDLGVCFYSKNHPAAKQYMVLKPRWLLNALYIIIFNGRDYAVNGVIMETDVYELICKKVSEENIKKVYTNITYKTKQIQYILTVLKNFELIFRLDDERIFIPMLCDENEPESIDAFVSEKAVHISFEYSYLPENVLHRLMVRHGYELDTGNVWRTGAVFKNSRCGWTAMVQINENCLDVYVNASHPDTHPVTSYLAILRDSIYRINNSFGLSAVEFVTFQKQGIKDRFEYDILEGSINAGLHEVYSKEFHDRVSIDEILGNVKNDDIDNQINRLLDAITAALQKLQSNSTYYNANENMCNSYVRDILDTSGYICKDQTFQGISLSGKSSGMLDMMIREKDTGSDLTIYEALRLKSFGKSDKEYLDLHLKKLLDNYNARGFNNLFLISYVSWEKEQFNNKADQYCAYVTYNVPSPFTVTISKQVTIYNASFIRCLRISYDCGGITMYVYHFIVRVAQ